MTVSPDSPVVLVGPSGSGKTTLLRLISGLDRPDSGEIHIGGRLASSAGYVLEPHKRDLGFMFQKPALWPHMTVAQNIVFGMAGKTRVEVNNRLHELTAATSLEGLELRYPHQLSEGQARRVSLARTLAPGPKHLLMDEPLTSLDPELKSSILALIRSEVAASCACLVYVTHDDGEAGALAGRVITMKNGRVGTG